MDADICPVAPAGGTESLTPLTLRTAAASDYAALGLWVPDADTCIRWAGPRLRFPFEAAQLPQLLAEPGAHSFALHRGGGPALGFGQYWMRGIGAAHLARIILAPSVRGQGLAGVLCRLLMAEATRLEGARAFTLRVYRDNQPALATYRRLGFAEVSERSDGRVFFMQTPFALSERAPADG